MQPEDRYDSLIQYWWEFFAPAGTEIDWRLAKEVVRQESSFNANAISPAGARGLMQIMRGTWGDDADYDRNWNNPEQNLRRGVQHLFYLWKMFAQETGMERWKFALGAYNAGQGWIIKSQAYLATRKRPTDQWAEIADVLRHFTGPENAQQTTSYVAKIIDRYQDLGALSG